jgi:hypothetical protein
MSVICEPEYVPHVDECVSHNLHFRKQCDATQRPGGERARVIAPWINSITRSHCRIVLWIKHIILQDIGLLAENCIVTASHC